MTTLVLDTGARVMRRAVARAAAGMARHGIRFFRFFARPLAATPLAMPDGVEIRRLDQGEALALGADPALELRPGMVAAAFARGDACFAAFRDGRPLAYCWLATTRLPHLDGIWVDFARGTGWIYKSLVLPAARGRGLAPALYRFAEREALSRRCSATVICVETHNTPSIRAALRAGYAPAGYAAYVLRGPSVAGWTSPAARKRGIRFSAPRD
jgi:GNAT superfamily N-acetyltransferase